MQKDARDVQPIGINLIQTRLDRGFIDVVVGDIKQNARTFLPPGRPRDAQSLRTATSEVPLLIGGLSERERFLIRSVLPDGVIAAELWPLDKGMSGSLVFAGRYVFANGRTSKQFVFKIGARKKIEREYKAIVDEVAPHLAAISVPWIRLGKERGLLVQELAGMDKANRSLLSFREFCLSDSTAAETLEHLLNDRLLGWYEETSAKSPVTLPIQKLLEWYLGKAGTQAGSIASGWTELSNWLASVGVRECRDVQAALGRVLAAELTFTPCVIHGDLHTENILVDDRQTLWLIDFYWSRGGTTALLDCAMLEVSLRCRAIPFQVDLRTLLPIEHQYALDWAQCPTLPEVPYHEAATHVYKCVDVVRKFARDRLGVSFKDYRRILLAMTFAHLTHSRLNRPLVWASVRTLLAREDQQ